MHKEIMKYLPLAILSYLILLPGTAMATEIIGRYSDISPQKVVFTLTLGHSAPNGIIIQHHSPAGSISSTTPSATKIDQPKGVAKWLLRDPESGSHTFTLEFNRPVNRSQLYFLLRYHDQAKFIEKTIKP